MPPHLVAIMIFGTISLILIGIVIVLVWRILLLRRTGHRVTGQCVNVYWEPHPLDRSWILPRKLWFATVSYTTPDGDRYRLQVQTRRYTLGELIPVLVPRGQPDRARVDSAWQLWWAPALVGFIAVVFVLATVMVGSTPAAINVR